jgi:hypothetical protein
MVNSVFDPYGPDGTNILTIPEIRAEIAARTARSIAGSDRAAPAAAGTRTAPGRSSGKRGGRAAIVAVQKARLAKINAQKNEVVSPAGLPPRKAASARAGLLLREGRQRTDA